MGEEAERFSRPSELWVLTGDRCISKISDFPHLGMTAAYEMKGGFRRRKLAAVGAAA